MAKAKLISMKGLPCTGKTTLARKLAAESDYLLVELDDIRYPIARGSRNKLEDEVVDEISYQVACTIIEKHLTMGLNVLLDSPLSHQSHFDLMMRVAERKHAELVILECRPEDFNWKEWINQRSSSSQYKKVTWEEIQKLKDQRYGDYDTGNIRKVTADTTIPSLRVFDELLSSSLPSGGRDSVPFDRTSDKERDRNDDRDRAKRKMSKSGPRKVEKMNHHHVLEIVNKPSKGRDKCYGCPESITGESTFYRCNQCRFQLHKWCAEAPVNLERQFNEEIPFIDPETKEYRFPKTYRCGSPECGKKFSKDCLECLFKTQLKCGFLPAVVADHPCHPKHPLLLRIFRGVDHKDFKCRACGGRGDTVFYKCKTCKIYIHVNCTLLPRIIEHKCHLDKLHLVKPSPNDDDEFYCDACEEERNPNNWIYYCERCDFATHLNLDCVLSSTN